MNSILLSIILIPVIEIYLFIKIGSQIGAFNTISLILITAVIGIYYARYEGLNTLRSGISQMIKNEMPIYEIVSGTAIAFAAILMIIKLSSFVLNLNCWLKLINIVITIELWVIVLNISILFY